MYIMEMIETISWILTGFISSLFTMEAAWRIARGQAKGASTNKPIAMKLEVRSQ
jgi:hypothetical protein